MVTPIGDGFHKTAIPLRRLLPASLLFLLLKRLMFDDLFCDADEDEPILADVHVAAAGPEARDNGRRGLMHDTLGLQKLRLGRQKDLV